MAKAIPATPGVPAGARELILEQRFAARLSVLKQVRASVMSAARRCGFGEAAAQDIVLALDEACKNVIVHAYKGSDEDIVLRVFELPDGILLELRDFAALVDPAQIKPRDLDDVRPGQLGTHFMRAIMDSVEFLTAPDGAGNLLQMKKKREIRDMANEVTEMDDKLLVRLSGDVDLEHCVPVRQLLLDAVGRGRDLLIDLSGVTYVDSSGIASMVEALQLASKNGTALKLFSAPDQVRRVFELARLDQVFGIHPNLDAALAAGD